MSITLPTYSRLEIPLLGRRERLWAIIATGLRQEVRRPAAIAITVLGAAFTTITSIVLLFLAPLLLPGQRTDTGDGPVFTGPPAGAIDHLRIYAARRDRFDDPVRPRVPGEWELILKVPVKSGVADATSGRVKPA